MKFDFWFDLPQVLANIQGDALCSEDKEYCKLIVNSQEDYNKVFNAFNENLEKNMNDLETTQLELIRARLGCLKKEKAEHLCKSIKFCTKLMVKILTSIENAENRELLGKDLLLKIKFFLKVTRLVVENAKIALGECKSEKEREFFTMIYTFAEKVQSKLFALSNNLIKQTLAQKMTEKREVLMISQNDMPDLVKNI